MKVFETTYNKQKHHVKPIKSKIYGLITLAAAEQIVKDFSNCNFFLTSLYKN